MPNDKVSVEVESLAPGGDAVGRQTGGEGARAADDGRVTFVPLAAPGERVRARVEREKGKVAWAELVEIERASPDRVGPPCPLFGTCGGCQWQHVTAAAQLAAKRAIVERALVSVISDPLAPRSSDPLAPRSGERVRERGLPEIVAAGPPFGYRDRAKLAVGPGGTLGFRARRSHDIVDVPACPLFGPELARALPALRGTARGLAAGVEIEVQAGNDGVHVNVSHADPTSAAHARREIDRLAAAGVVGLSLAGKPTLGQPDVDVAEPGWPPLRVPADGFAQVGRAGNTALVAAVMEAVGASAGVVLELYAGSGNLTRHLVRAAGVTKVSACDGDPAAIARGARNVPEAAWSLRPPAVEPDLVVLDPPREGADKAHLAAASRARRRIVYVSCDPQTLGRDARLLRASGFELTRAQALDLMPQTFHVEVVATFDRVGAQ